MVGTMTNEESLGERLSALVETLVAGARAAASETASQSLKDAFQDLKTNLVDAYGLVSVHARGSPIGHRRIQEVLREELEEHPVIADDKAVLTEKDIRCSTDALEC